MKYYISPHIKWKVFKELNDKLYAGTGPDIVPLHGDRMLWEMLRDRKINIGINTKHKSDPIFFSLKKIPKNAKIIG